ncbi:tripartite motif-containing protein 16 isoform X2 [Engraulis encrasicolus]|uniref:tripartite motif-containing protein 16 isoform X2 n=1 Tax=Engraulis encrasicolus TaxID=184585 RepID=UPI002FD1C069
MGANGSMDTQGRGGGSTCPLCHNECRNQTTLRCRHRFCEGCIYELWSSSQSGPYYCPECKQEYRKLNDALWNTASPSASRYHSGWRDRLSSPASHRSFLGKRQNTRPLDQQHEGGGGHRLGTTAPSTNGIRRDDGADYYDDGASPPRKRANSSPNVNSAGKTSTLWDHGTDRRGSQPLEGTSATLWSSAENPAARQGPIILESDDSSGGEEQQQQRSDGQSPVDEEMPLEVAAVDPEASPKLLTPPRQKSPRAPPPSATDIHPPSPLRAHSVSGSPPANTSSHRHPSPAAASRQPPSPRQQSSPPLRDTTTHHHTSPRTSPNSASSSSSSSSPTSRPVVPCHYCPTKDQRPAVKTCLQCGASMCPEHLRTHLESPVFQGHPLVPAVADVSPWRCQEHQEMNRIYCRPCAVCVCTVCTVIGSHREHACISIKEAEKELRGQMKEEMKKLQEHERAIATRNTELLQKKQAFQEVLEEARANVQSQYQAMREALDQEEQQALRCVAQEEARSLGGVEGQLHLLQGSLTTIQHSMDTLTGLADATGVLRAQDQAFIMEYNKVANRISGISSPVDGLDCLQEVDRARLECLRGWTERRLDTVVISRPHRDPFRLLYGISPVLDPDTAHPKLLLSAGDRRVSFSDTAQPYPESEGRFSSFPQVLATEALRGGGAGGRWYWEVEVSADEGGRWKVGVCDGQIGRKGQKDASRLGFNALSWCLLSEGKGKVEVLHDKATTAVCSDAPRRVGVLLDYEEAALSFFTVAEEGDLTLLYSYQLPSDTQPLYPALAVSKTQLTVCDLFQDDGADESVQE